MSTSKLKRDSTRHKFDYYEGKVEALEVFSWCPTPEPTVPPTQVHLHFPIAGDKVVFRFKGPGTLDALIAALVDHRRHVFGEKPEDAVLSEVRAEAREAERQAEDLRAKLVQADANIAELSRKGNEALGVLWAVLDFAADGWEQTEDSFRKRHEFERRFVALRQLAAAIPIPMILHCPRCGAQHIDVPNAERGWTNPPHRSHECQACGCIWRPADVPTMGVAEIATRGSADTWEAAIDPARYGTCPVCAAPPGELCHQGMWQYVGCSPGDRQATHVERLQAGPPVLVPPKGAP